MIIPMLLPGHNTKKKYWPKSPWLKKTPKLPWNANFVASFDDFWTLFCHFDSLHSTENLGGSAQTFHIFLFKIWKKITIFPQECKELLVFGISQTPSNAARSSRGWWKPKFCLTFVAKYCKGIKTLLIFYFIFGWYFLQHNHCAVCCLAWKVDQFAMEMFRWAFSKQITRTFGNAGKDCLISS